MCRVQFSIRVDPMHSTFYPLGTIIRVSDFNTSPNTDINVVNPKNNVHHILSYLNGFKIRKQKNKTTINISDVITLNDEKNVYLFLLMFRKRNTKCT